MLFMTHIFHSTSYQWNSFMQLCVIAFPLLTAVVFHYVTRTAQLLCCCPLLIHKVCIVLMGSFLPLYAGLLLHKFLQSNFLVTEHWIIECKCLSSLREMANFSREMYLISPQMILLGQPFSSVLRAGPQHNPRCLKTGSFSWYLEIISHTGMRHFVMLLEFSFFPLKDERASCRVSQNVTHLLWTGRRAI